jgi:ribose-phosphate pyrophosphokinase
MKLLTCNSNLPLSEAMSAYLGIPMTRATVKRFADQEVFVEVHDNVRGEDVFIIQSTSYPANDRASARRVTAVMPYFGYARQDRKPGPRTPISAKLVANIITSAGADRVLTLDLHAGQIQGFFDIPVDNLYSAPVLVQDIVTHKRPENDDALMIVSPDVGGVVRARNFAKRLNADLAIVDKRRDKANVSEVMNIIGDVKGRDCILVDDIVDTAGTLCNAAEALMNEGAASVSACVTHGVLSGPAIERIGKSSMKELVITDSIKPTDAVKACGKIRVVSMAPLLAEAVRRISEETSVSSLFD